MLPSHDAALWAIQHCRTPLMGAHLGQCAQCQTRHLLYHSCRHRACPRCGYDRTEQWLKRQRELLLPVRYFHVVFTLPAEWRRLVRSHQRQLLPVLFRSAFDALATLCREPRFLGAQIGALCVLHTWTRTLEYHPHVHMLVPGGGVDGAGQWRTIPTRRKLFLVPLKRLALLFRRYFIRRARKALGAEVAIPFVPPHKRWVVFAKPTVQGPERVLQYLGRYVHKTAITDRAIVQCNGEHVTFRYRHSRDATPKLMRLSAHEFLRRFLQHVLPKGFHRVRAFGLLHPHHRLTLKRVQLLLNADVSEPAATKPRPIRCPHCRKGTLALLRRLTPQQCIQRLAMARGPPT